MDELAAILRVLPSMANRNGKFGVQPDGVRSTAKGRQRNGGYLRRCTRSGQAGFGPFETTGWLIEALIIRHAVEVEGMDVSRFATVLYREIGFFRGLDIAPGTLSDADAAMERTLRMAKKEAIETTGRQWLAVRIDPSRDQRATKTLKTGQPL